MSGTGRKSSLEGAGVRSEHTEWGTEEKERRGHKWEGKEGRGPQLPDTLVKPAPCPHVTSWALGLGSIPTSTAAQETHLSGFTALSFFFGLKERPAETRRRRIRKAKHPTLLPRSQAYPGPSRGTWSPLRGTTMPSTPQPGLCELRSGAWLAPAFTLAVFFQGHLPQLTARVPDHEDLCSGEQGERQRQRRGR